MAGESPFALSQVWQVSTETIATRKSGKQVNLTIKWHPETKEEGGKIFAKLCKWDKTLCKLVWSRRMKMVHDLDEGENATLNCSFIDDLLKIRSRAVQEAVFQMGYVLFYIYV